MTPLSFARETPEGLLLEVYVQPKAARNEMVGLHQGRLKLRLTAPPVEGEANKECLKFLSALFRIPKTRMDIVQGQRSRQKTIRIRDLSLEALGLVLKEHGMQDV